MLCSVYLAIISITITATGYIPKVLKISLHLWKIAIKVEYNLVSLSINSDTKNFIRQEMC